MPILETTRTGEHDMAGRPRHPNKHIEAALQYAASNGWTVEKRKGHAWGRMYCRHADRGGCIDSIYSTPKNPEGHARYLKRQVDNCPHPEAEEE